MSILVFGSAAYGVAARKRQGSGVDAIPQPRWLWAIVKNMTQVRATLPAPNFDSRHAVGVVGQLFNHLAVHRFPITGPTAAGVELGLRVEKARSATHAVVVAPLPVVPKPACEGALRGGTAGDVVVDLIELLAPLLIGFAHRVAGVIGGVRHLQGASSCCASDQKNERMGTRRPPRGLTAAHPEV